TLPVYTGVKGPQGYVVVRVEGVKQGETDNPMLASLPIELNQAWGQAEQQAVLKAMRVQADVTLLPEAQQALSRDNEAQNSSPWRAGWGAVMGSSCPLIL